MNLSHPYGLYAGKAVKFGLSAPPPCRSRAHGCRGLPLTPLLRKGRRVRAHFAFGHIDIRDGNTVHGYRWLARFRSPACFALRAL
jgi:hypothetical protein